MLLLDDYEQLKRDVADLQRKNDEIVGAEKQVAARVRERFGCASYGEAKALREKTHKKVVEMAAEFTRRKEKFVADHTDQLGEKDDG